MLDAYTAIEDYHYGDQPPYGCQHIFVGVENKSEKSKGDGKDEKLTPIKSYSENIENLSKMGITVENAPENKNFILNEINEAFSYLQHDFNKLSKDDIPKIIKFDVDRFKHDFGDKYKEYVAGFDKKTGNIFINNEANIFKNKDFFSMFSNWQNKVKYYSTSNQSHFFIQEFYHSALYKNNPRLFKKLEKYTFNEIDKKTIKNELSTYATESGLEFVAEYETRILFNLPINKKIKDIYLLIKSL